MRRAYLVHACAFACVLVVMAGCGEIALQAVDEPEAVCGTDSECMLHCPPPNDDPDCDGGPQSLLFDRPRVVRF